MHLRPRAKAINVDNFFRFRFHFYRPQRSCEGYVFTLVCLSTRGVSASVHAGIPHPPRSRHPPRGRHPRREQTLPQSRHPPGTDTPKEETPQRSRPPGADIPLPPKRWPLLQTVCILLECIVVPRFKHTLTLLPVHCL